LSAPSLITSRSNPKVKQARALRARKGRVASAEFLIEGIHPVGEALAAAAESPYGPVVEAIFYAPDRLTSPFALELIQAQAARGLACLALSSEVFDSLVEKENPQGILAVARPRRCSLAELNPANFPWGVGLVSPQDPGNLGSILRTIDAVGASGLLLLDSSLDPYQPGVVRASMGALFWRPLVSATFDEFLDWARQQAYQVYGTSAHAGLDYNAGVAYARPLILLMGSERAGLTAEQRAACRAVVRLPMRGRASSLNLAVATGIMLYKILEGLS
jgi:TrmH family RNA methyltransferase